MIKILGSGIYELIETKKHTKILILDKKKIFAWVSAEGIGEILVASYHSHISDYVLSLGKYRIYEVKDESDLVDLLHLELFVGESKWQGYLLPTGLPTKKERRKRIVPTGEIITKYVN